jgi:hypothetical protein
MSLLLSSKPRSRSGKSGSVGEHIARLKDHESANMLDAVWSAYEQTQDEALAAGQLSPARKRLELDASSADTE